MAAMAKPLPHPDLTEALEAKHCRAIYEEIGERLQHSLAHDASPVPSHLRGLLDRLAALEGGAPLNVPDREPAPQSRSLRERIMRFLRFP
jgi:hypothetical protein